MSNNLDRKMARTQGRLTAKEGSRVFREALKVAGNVEAGLKATTNKLPLRRRLRIAWGILLGRWR